MFKIKICGITSPEDALLAAEAGADAIGLNFYEQSPRYVTPERGAEISQALNHQFENRPDLIPTVIGVFVTDRNLPGTAVATALGREQAVEQRSNELWQTALTAGLRGFQLHGDEPPELILDLNIANDRHGFSWFERWISPDPIFPIVRAFRCRETNLLEASDYLRRCIEVSDEFKETAKKMAGSDVANFPVLPSAVLLDAYAPGAYGGTGQIVDWNVVRNERDLLMGLPVILAGGLTPENVAEAIATAQPDAVDVASGVESSPGKKDPDKVRRFVDEARRAFASLPARRTDN
jgi:phosphoribosylanthranilate isomerase